MNREPRVSLLPTQTSPAVVVAGICIANCAISIVSTCLYYSELHRLHEFPFFAAQLNAAIGALLSGCLLIVMPKDSRASPCHLTYWFRLAALLSAQNCLEIVSIPRVGNDDLPPILQQAVVPLSLTLSTLILRRSYNNVQLVGSACVVFGIVVGFLPSLFAIDSRKQTHVAWVSVFLVSRLPQAAANVVAEGFLEGHRDFAWAVRATLYTQLLGMHLPQLVSLGCAIIMHFGRFACCEPGSIWLAWLGSPPADFHLSRKVLCFCNGVLSTLLFAIAMSIRAMARQSVGLPAGRNGCLPASCRASFRFCSFCISALARVVTVDR
ncbi:crtp3 [Symbiodinium natans]|uniref:Crtp3 protein n=1 Tax=Symbiodinium natans TaxID=878477 RepID=A0A812UTH0_9DINO|nr:crtp3 [Symbiodinium natans]